MLSLADGHHTTQGQDSSGACSLFSVGVLKWAKGQVIAAADFVWSWEDVVRWGYLEPESAKKTMQDNAANSGRGKKSEYGQLRGVLTEEANELTLQRCGVSSCDHWKIIAGQKGA